MSHRCPIQNRYRINHCGFKHCTEPGAAEARCRLHKPPAEQKTCSTCGEFRKVDPNK